LESGQGYGFENEIMVKNEIMGKKEDCGENKNREEDHRDLIVAK